MVPDLYQVKIGLKMRAPQGSPPKIFAPPGPLKGVPPQFRTVIKKLGEKSGGAPRGTAFGRATPPAAEGRAALPPNFPPTFLLLFGIGAEHLLEVPEGRKKWGDPCRALIFRPILTRMSLNWYK